MRVLFVAGLTCVLRRRLIEHLSCPQMFVSQEGSEGDDVLFSAAAVADGVVGVGNDDGMWNGALSSGGTDFVVVKLYSNGIVAWRLKVQNVPHRDVGI